MNARIDLDLLSKQIQLDRLKRNAPPLYEKRDADRYAEAARKNYQASHRAAPSTPSSDGGFSGFRSFGEQLQTCALLSMQKDWVRRPNPELVELQNRAAAAGGSEAVPADGGFIVARDFSQEILTKAYSTGRVLSRLTRRTCTVGDALAIPAWDEQSRADGSQYGGVKVIWENEADALVASKPKARLVQFNMHKLIALRYVTNELLADSVALEGDVMSAFVNAFRVKVEYGSLFGNGRGAPLGVMTSNALVTVSKETGQASSTIVFENCLKMWASLYDGAADDAIWLCHKDVTGQLASLTQVVGVAGSIVPTFQYSSADGQPNRLFGKPIYEVEYCPSLGTTGDLILMSPSQVALVTKGSINMDVSMHLKFLTDECAFRLTLRADCQPLWHTQLSPFSGTGSQSAFVALQAR